MLIRVLGVLFVLAAIVAPARAQEVTPCSSVLLLSAEGEKLGHAMEVAEGVYRASPCEGGVVEKLSVVALQGEIFSVVPGQLFTYLTLKNPTPKAAAAPLAPSAPVAAPTPTYQPSLAVVANLPEPPRYELSMTERNRMDELQKMRLSNGGPIALIVVGSVFAAINTAFAVLACEPTEDEYGEEVSAPGNCDVMRTMYAIGAASSVIAGGVGIQLLLKRAPFRQELKALRVKARASRNGARVTVTF
jgi:hypothetical protein